MENDQTPIETIREFFSIFHLTEAQEELTILQHEVLKIPGLSISEKGEELTYFCEKLRELISAVHQLKN